MPVYCSTVEKIPAGAHFAILRNESVYVSDGYGGGCSEPVLEYVVYKDEAAWKAEIEALILHGAKDWKAVRVVPASVTATVTVQVKEG